MTVPFAVPVTFTRYPEGYYEDDPLSDAFGFWVQPDAEEVIISACIQPFLARTDADQQTLQRLGVDGSDGLVRVYAMAEIRKTDPAAGTLGDRFEWEGWVYQVCDVSRWPGPRPHWKGFAALVTDTIDTQHREPPPPEVP